MTRVVTRVVVRGSDRRDLALLSAGTAVSTAGDAAALTALLLRVRPAGPGWVAGLLAAELVPIVVLAPLVGRVVDRVETRRLLFVALAGQALLAVPLALVRSPAATVALFGALGVLGALVRPATSAIVPVIAGAGRAARGYATIATGAGLGWIVGPAAGGLLSAGFGSRTALLADAATFAVLAAACLAIRTRRPRPALVEPAPAQPRGGARLLWADPVLRVALPVTALAIGCAVVDNVAAPFRFVDQLASGASGYGWYLALWGAGALLGAQLVPLLDDRRLEAALATGNLLTGLAIAGIGLAPALPVAYLAAVLGGVGNGLVNVAQNALIGGRVAPHQTGRAFATGNALTRLAIGVGTAAAAPLVHLLAADGAMIAAGGLAGLCALGALGLAVRRGGRSAAFS